LGDDDERRLDDLRVEAQSAYMHARIIRIGNSHGLRIPKALLAACRLESEDEVELSVEDEALVVRRARAPRAGWEAELVELATERKGQLLDVPASTHWEETEWEW
jgi:antitoxin MazE